MFEERETTPASQIEDVRQNPKDLRKRKKKKPRQKTDDKIYTGQYTVA
jgi:hypothetical protein